MVKINSFNQVGGTVSQIEDALGQLDKMSIDAPTNLKQGFASRLVQHETPEDLV